ncbi:MAG: ABC transporter permease, partial [Deltaproteobacteria bacterium]|nr:ABC transporter permease [Nannocystaceae bacterium]
GIVLGTALRRELGVELGERVRVVVPAELDGREESAGAPPRSAVFEVLDELHTGVAELDRNLVLVHLTAAQALFFRKGRVTGIEFELHDPDDAEALAGELTGRLPPLYRVSTWRESNSDMLITLQQIRVVISMILGLMGVVGAASLVASLLLIVRRKHHDIGVMLALGCDNRVVFWVFESVGLLAGAVGVVLGLALGGLYVGVIAAYRFPLGGDVYPIDHLPARLELADAAVPSVIAMVLCAIASGPVALLAARVRILSALNR